MDGPTLQSAAKRNISTLKDFDPQYLCVFRPRGVKQSGLLVSLPVLVVIIVVDNIPALPQCTPKFAHLPIKCHSHSDHVMLRCLDAGTAALSRQLVGF